MRGGGGEKLFELRQNPLSTLFFCSSIVTIRQLIRQLMKRSCPNYLSPRIWTSCQQAREGALRVYHVPLSYKSRVHAFVLIPSL